MTFEELGLNPELLKAVSDLGFTNPTPIQEQTIAILAEEDTDIVALAQTGTGKTAAFGLPMLAKLDAQSTKTQALILAPTRELCMQITNDLKAFSKYIKGLSVLPVYGGTAIVNQIKELRRGVQVVVATPGRLCDLIDRKAVQLNEVSIVVLDEADEMLNMGFKDDLDRILSQTPDQKSTWLFSATMPNEVSRIASKYMAKPKEISVGKKNQGAENIEHIYYVVQPRDRYLALKRVVDFYPEIYGIVFCRTKAETQEVADALIKDGYSADSLHGDLSQSQRDFVMKRFRMKTLQMLVATDVAARGIDVDSVTHVINYNLPEEIENYTHRSGRTARAGKHGMSIAIVTKRDVGRIKDIERKIGKQFKKARVPNGVEVTEKQLFNLVHKLHHVEVKDEEIEKFLPKIYEELNDLSKEELIKRFISEEFNRFYAYYEDAPDLNDGDDGGGNASRGARFFMNLGELDGLNPGMLKDYLSEIAKVHPRMVFNIDIKKSFSFFETEPKFKDAFLALNEQNIQFNNRVLNLEVSAGRSGGGGGYARGGEGKRHYGGGGEGGDRKRSYGGGSGGGERKRSYGNSGGGSSYGGGGDRKRSYGGGSDSGSSSGGGFRDKFKKKRY